MKKLLLVVILLATISIAKAQLLKKIKNKVEQKVNKPADPPSEKKNETTTTSSEVPKTDTVKKENVNTPPSSLKTYSKYDFVPGEKIVVFEDFSQDAVGDFPDKWNTNASGETVTVDGVPGHWFMLTKPGYFIPEFIDSFPENFTLEYDLLIDQPVHSWGISTAIMEFSKGSNPETWRSVDNSYAFNLLPGAGGRGSCDYNRRKMGVGEGASIEISHFSDITKPVHVAIWRQKERVRLYLNQEKAFDVPRAIAPEAKLNTLLFWIQLTDKWHFLISNLRLGVGAPDLRNKFLKENKWVTHGILFDVNSDKIKPESYGSLKEMADLLKEYADLKVKIVGHTDADGNDANNLDLSKRRAAAVKEALAREFAIDQTRIETDGKGETEPIDKNTTSAGKANNRRVEFIKL